MCISVVVCVYNEERRIANLLETLRWCDDIVVVDKSSTDRTREIAESYGAKLVVVPYSDMLTCEFGHGAAKYEWVLSLTASDMVHPALAEKIQTLVREKGQDYDIIAFPYVVGALGVISPHSPWNYPLKKMLYKKSIAKFQPVVHKEMVFASDKVYWMEPNGEEAVFHLTHQSLDSFFERHIRYNRSEAMNFSSMGRGLLRSACETVAAIGWMTLVRRTWLLGIDGIALMVAFVTYFLMKFLYVWERFRGKGDERYEPIRAKIRQAWADSLKAKGL